MTLNDLKWLKIQLVKAAKLSVDVNEANLFSI